MNPNKTKSKTKEKSNSKSKKLEKQNKLLLEEIKEHKAKIRKYKYGDYISKWSIQFYKEWWKKTFKKRDLFFIIMQLRNGKYDMFTVATEYSDFGYKRGRYLIDPDMIREDIHTGLNTLYYHQDISTPFRIDFDIDDLRNKLEATNKDVVKAINPMSLKSFIHSEVIEKVMKGQELTNEMKFIKMVTVLNLCVGLAMLGIFAKSMGWI